MRWHLTGAVQRHQIERGAYVEGDERSIEEVFPSERQAPGLNIDPNNFSGELALTLDFRDRPGRPHSGFWAEGFFGSYRGSGPDGVDYVRYGGEAQGFLPLGRGRVLALRAAGEESRTGGSLPIKFTELSSLGGRSSLRGYLENGFRAQAAVLGRLPLRWGSASMANSSTQVSNPASSSLACSSASSAKSGWKSFR